MTLTARQAELLRFIESYIAAHHGVAPSFDEMQEALGLRGRGGIHRLLKGLEDRRCIRRFHHMARAIEVLPDSDGELERLRELVAALRRENDMLRARVL